jgi:DNA-binding phage protein
MRRLPSTTPKVAMAEHRFLHDKYLVGRVRVALSSITFQDEIEGRLPNDAIVEYLTNVFATGSKGCEPDRLENHISAIISPADLNRVLHFSGLTRNDLQQSLLDGEYPTLNALSNVYCVDGKHRIAAAERLFVNSRPDQIFWTVALHCFDINSKSAVVKVYPNILIQRRF